MYKHSIYLPCSKSLFLFFLFLVQHQYITITNRNKEIPILKHKSKNSVTCKVVVILLHRYKQHNLHDPNLNVYSLNQEIQVSYGL